MSDGLSGSDRRQELIEVIRRVRNRWRLKLALRGGVIVAAGTFAALFLSASGLEALRFTPSAIIAFRITAFAVFGALVYFGWIRPLKQRVTDSQVAMYLEEKDPSLQTAILSAVDTSGAVGGESGPSPKLVERLVDQAITQCRAIDDGLAIERQGLRNHLATLGAVAAVVALIIAFGPAFIRSGLSALLIVSRSAEASSPYQIEVVPGNTTIPRGSDQSVKATLQGFTASEAMLMFRSSPGAPFEPVPLIEGSEPGSFEAMLFHVDKETTYFVESNGVRSPTFSLAVLDLPTVDKLVLEYRFPAYTGLEPRVVDPGGDVAAIQGTEVRLKVTPTMQTAAGRVKLNDTDTADLEVQPDGTLAGLFKVENPGFYRIELDGPKGEKVNASPQYTIDVLADQTPAVRFSKPGRDTTSTPVEEVFAEVRADDDFGVNKVQMFYSVNGGAEKTINLFGGSKALPEVTAGHTIYLEELDLKPGDFVSYYAKATDNDGVQGPKTTTSDIYFVQIRPFRTDFRPAQSQAGAGMGGGGAGDQVGQLSQQQRQIVAATFNLVRDKPKMTADKFRETVVFLTLAQARLREQVEELSEKMNSRLDVVDPSLKTIAGVLPKAATEMKSAEGELKGQRAKEALSPEQRALKLLQEAEQQYELQVAMNNGGGGGGGGGANNQLAAELADLFELEMDKLANQYEMQQRADMQSAEQSVDALAEKLKELARRQQQEAERQRRLAAQGGGGASGGGDQQRQLAQELEEAARRLEQLSRDEQRQNLQEAVRDLQQAANAMRQAAAAGGRDGGAQAAAAAEQLREAQRRLEQNQGGRAERDVQDALKKAGELADDQREVANDVQSLDQQAAGEGRQSRAQGIASRKDEMDKEVANLQNQLEQIANEARTDNRDAARKLDEAAGSITDKRIREKIRYTRNTLQGNSNEYARAMEGDIGANLEALQKKIADAASSFGEATKQDARERALDRTRDVVRGLESLDQRMRDAQRQRGQNGQQGQQGQAGQQGDQQGQQGQQGGQDGQQGQQGQAGQQGQQGQQGQGGQQGQQGQGGQNGQAGGDNAGGSPNAGGAYGGGYGGGDYRNWNGGGYWSPDDIRQFRREFQEWRNEAEALRQELTRVGIDPRELDAAMRELRGLDNDQVFVDPRNLSALQAAALEKMKQFEFSLRKQTDTANQQLSLSGSDEVPAGFRTAIEEYYRSLARRPTR